MKKVLLLLSLMIAPGLLLGDEKPADTESARKKEQAEQASGTDDDPFACASGDSYLIQRPGEWRKKARITSTQIRLEWFETDTKETITQLDDWKPNQDASVIRNNLLKLEKTTVKESLLTQLDVGETSTTETILELIYPTEYEPPEGLSASELPSKDKTPKQNDVAKRLAEALAAACPTAFETRNTGLTTKLALEPCLTGDGEFDLRFYAEHVRFVKMIEYGQNEVATEMPLFSGSHTGQTLRLKSGQWRLVSVQPAIDPKSGTPDSTRRLVLFIRLDVLEK